MKKIIIIILLIGNLFRAYAQKAVIDTSVYGKWPDIGGVILSNDGKYACYTTNSPVTGSTVIVKATLGSWEKRFKGAYYYKFSPNNRQLFFSRSGSDSLCALTLGNDKMTVMPDIASWAINEQDKVPSLIYQTTTSPQQITTIRNLTTGEQQSFNDVVNYSFNTKGVSLLLQKDLGHQQIELKWVDFPTGGEIPIWRGPKPENLTFTSDGSGIIFESQDSSQVATKQLWVYKSGKAEAVHLDLNEHGTPLAINSLSNFRLDYTGKRLFFIVNKPINKPTPNPALASVDIYSYKDAKLRSQQLLENQPTYFTYIYKFSNHRTIRLQMDDEEVKSSPDGDWLLIWRRNGGDDENEWNWNKKALISIYIISTIDGTHKCIATAVPDPIAETYRLSPTGKYVTWYDPLGKDFYSYNIKTGNKINMTKGVKATWTYDYSSDFPDSSYGISGRIIAGWAKGDSSVWLTSRYDIFQADPEGKQQPINLTNGYGARHHITFNVCQLSEDKTIDLAKSVILHFVNQDTKAEGFCKVRSGVQKDPERLSAFSKHFTSDLSKARYAEVYTVSMEDEKSAGNYFLTRDLKKFIPLTNIQPQKNYNWLTAELIHFKTKDGKSIRGILYKPENFDPKKKYPVIFHYYERLSDKLHHFYYPNYKDGGTIDIPTYVSNGYLVFLPDIYFQVGHPGRSACNTIVSAAEYLSKFSWVDAKQIGLMGHSFGGFETDYVISHSGLFAAAVSISGITDFVSAYGSIIGDGTSRQRSYELYRDRIGATLWQRPDLYIENSPVFKINNVTTPVLLMANKKDGDVPYEQGFEFFTGLRRLGKKAWLLQYDNGGHQLETEIDSKDITLRIKQFFDYYLKAGAPPGWMTRGIPASQKQVDSGLEIDKNGVKP